jgi:hypothetical protein
MESKDALIDLESGSCNLVSELSNGVDASSTVGQARTAHNGTWNGSMGANEGVRGDGSPHMGSSPPASDASSTKNGDDRKSEGDEKLGLLDSSGAEKTKKKRSKKPPRPPRPPTPTPLDISDQKLLNELNEIAVLKRARIERMKALKKMKNAKEGSSSTNLCPLIITIIFCVVILWQGILC